MGQTSYRKLFGAAALAVAVCGAVSAAGRAIADRRHLVTGKAQWIWATRLLPEPGPLRFTAERRFALAGPAARAEVKIFVDGSSVLWINGERVGSSQKRPGDSLDVHDVGRLLRGGENRVAIEVASESGAGGILFLLEFGPGDPAPIVSDGRWTVGGASAAVWGRPPMYPWGYPPTPTP